MLTLTFGISALVPPPPQFFSVGNTGTLTLTAGQYSVSSSANTLIEACSLGWNEGANTCAGGTITTVVSTGASPNASTIVPSVGSHIRLRARITVVLLSLGTTVTVGVSVDRSKVRSATTTNS